MHRRTEDLAQRRILTPDHNNNVDDDDTLDVSSGQKRKLRLTAKACSEEVRRCVPLLYLLAHISGFSGLSFRASVRYSLTARSPGSETSNARQSYTTQNTSGRIPPLDFRPAYAKHVRSRSFFEIRDLLISLHYKNEEAERPFSERRNRRLASVSCHVTMTSRRRAP